MRRSDAIGLMVDLFKQTHPHHTHTPRRQRQEQTAKKHALMFSEDTAARRAASSTPRLSRWRSVSPTSSAYTRPSSRFRSASSRSCAACCRAASASRCSACTCACRLRSSRVLSWRSCVSASNAAPSFSRSALSSLSCCRSLHAQF
jgi:hypothetical protein